MTIGERVYTKKCTERCQCQDTGQLTCEKVSGPHEPECRYGFMPMSTIDGAMTDLCKNLIANDTTFDGCCVPEACQSEMPVNAKDGRNFKLSNDLSIEEKKQSGSKQKNEKKIAKTSVKPKVQQEKEVSIKDVVDEKKEDEDLTMVMNVLSQTDHSAVIKLPKSEDRAILSIALTSELSKEKDDASEMLLWKNHEIPAGLNTITLSDLKANTSYTLKYKAGDKVYPSILFMTEELGKEKGNNKHDDHLIVIFLHS